MRPEDDAAAVSDEAIARLGAARRDVAAVLEHRAGTTGALPFLTGDTTLTYEQAAETVRRAATGLALRGVGRGDRVAGIGENSPELILLAFAAARIGAIFTLLHPDVPPVALERILAQVEPRVVVREAASFDALASAPDDAPPFPGIDLDPVALVYTSGSTGEPRGVVVTHDNVLFSTAAIQARLGYRSSDRVGLFVPLSFDYGLYQAFLVANAGASLYVGRPSMSGPGFLSVLETEEISVLPLVPGQISSLLKLLDRRPRELPHLRAVTSTGEYLPPADVAALHERFPRVAVYPMYGLTECKRVSILLPSEADEARDSVGRPLAGTEVFAVDAAGTPLPAGAPGELVIRGRHVTRGYWRAEAETESRFRSRDGGHERELWTGDLGRIDARGFIHVSGRTDSLIKRRGFRMTPLELEREACAVPGVVEGAAVHVADGDRLVLFARVVDGLARPEAALLEELRRRLEPYKLPDEIRVVEELPRTRSAKIDRRELERLVRVAGEA